MDDQTLLARWAEGDADAGRALYERYADRLCRFFLRRVDEGASDLVQQSFLRLLRTAREGGRVESVGGLLFAAARSLLYDRYRRELREQARFEPQETSLADLRTGASTALGRQERGRLLLLALQRLPLDAQLALELYYWEELPMDQVGQALGVSRTAAISRVHRAREQLRLKIAEIEASPQLVAEVSEGFETWARGLDEKFSTSRAVDRGDERPRD